MSPRCGSNATFLLLLLFTSLPVVRSSSSCAQARLFKNPNAKVIGDCNLLDDKLNLNLNQLTSQPLCIREIRVIFGKQDDAKWVYAAVDRQRLAVIKNLFVASERERCVQQTITAKVTFLSSSREHETDFVVNPMNCFKSTRTTFQPTTEQGTVKLDLSRGINQKLWKTCLETVSFGTRDGNPLRFNRRQAQALPVPFDFEGRVCRDHSFVVDFNFYGGTTKTTSMDFLKVMKQLGTKVQVIDDCDLFEDQFTVSLDKLIDRPWCGEKTTVKIGLTSYETENTNQDYVKITNFLKSPKEDSRLNRCQKTSVTVITEVGLTQYTTNFDLDPIKCFDPKKELKYEEEGNDILFVDLTKDIAFNAKLFETCLTRIKIFDQNKAAIPFKKLAQNPNRIKIVNLNRLKNQTLTVQYSFQGGLNKTKQIFVPYSLLSVRLETERVEKKRMVKTATIVGAVVGASLVIITMLALGCFWRKRRVKEEPMDIDENDTYGTYARGWDGENDYGAGDVVEMVDNNELYGT